MICILVVLFCFVVLCHGNTLIIFMQKEKKKGGWDFVLVFLVAILFSGMINRYKRKNPNEARLYCQSLFRVL